MKLIRPSTKQLEQMANTYAQEVLTRVPFGLHGLDDKDFENAMDTIARELAKAWYAGYKFGSELT